MFLLIVLIAIIALYFLGKKTCTNEPFIFEVTKAKTKCLWNPNKVAYGEPNCGCGSTCGICCSKGFIGQKMAPFRYSGDNERGMNCPYQGSCPPIFPTKGSYYSLQDTYSGI